MFFSPVQRGAEREDKSKFFWRAKNMKRILRVALACLLVAAMCVSVMATPSVSQSNVAPTFSGHISSNNPAIATDGDTSADTDADADADADTDDATDSDDGTTTEEVNIDEPEESTDTDEEPDELDVDDTTETPAEEPTTDSNPTTGVVLALVPMAVAAAAVVASKRR